MRTVRNIVFVTLLGFVVAMPVAWAQQQTQDQSAQPAQPAQPDQPVQPAQPIPALRSPLASAADNGDSQSSDQGSQSLSPDTRPLAGAQDLSLGAPTGNHRYWQPLVSLTSTIDSNPPAATTQPGWTVWTSIFRGFNFHRNSEKNKLNLAYFGWVSISSGGVGRGIGNTIFHTMTLSEQVKRGRSTISFFDSLSFLPDAAFGYAGTNGIPLPGGGTIGLGNGFYPDQGILTAQTQILSNSFVTQVQTDLTRRSSLTFLGGYTLLRYFGTNLLDSNGLIFQAGYNYEISRKDTFSIFYRYNTFSFSNFNQSIHDNSIQAVYGRRVTGRLAFRVGAGPNFASFTTPISGNPVSGSGSATGPTSQTFFSVTTGLTYQLGRTALAFSYNHGISGGSGVLAGSVANNLYGSASRQFGRTVNGIFSFGYARNTGLSIATVTPSNQAYNYAYVGAYVSRHLGRDTT